MSAELQEMGPVELVVIEYPGDAISSVAELLTGLLGEKSVRLLDLVYVAKAADGQTHQHELYDIEPDNAIGDVNPAAPGLVSVEDLNEIAGQLAPGSTAAVVVVEHRWALQLSTAVANAGATVTFAEHIPAPVVRAALDFHEEDRS